MSAPAQRTGNGLIWTAVVVLLIAGFVAAYIPKLRDARNLRLEKYKLNQQIAEQEQEYRRLVDRQQALRNDPATVSRTLREKLGLARPGETVYRFEQENNASQRERP